ncbi:MAG: hypothetical protein WAT79_11175 [Saprospiraceae bacterium]
MEKEVVHHVVEFLIDTGAFDPSRVNENVLKDLGIIDDENALNRKEIRSGAPGAYFAFTNTTKDKIEVRPEKIVINSKTIERINFIHSRLSDYYNSVKIYDVIYITDYHIFGDKRPFEVINSYSNIPGLKLDVVRYVYDETLVTMYICLEQKLHFHLSSTVTKDKLFADIDFEEYSEIDNKFREFVNNQLKLNYEN